MSLGLPFIAISPLASAHLPDCLVKAATTKIDFPRTDDATVERTIRIVMQRRRDGAVHSTAGTSVEDLILAVRFDRTPTQCTDELLRLADLKKSRADARGLVLSQLHGLGEARAWAQSSIADIQAWKQGRYREPRCRRRSPSRVRPAAARRRLLPCIAPRRDFTWSATPTWRRGRRAARATWSSAPGDEESFEEARANAPSCIIMDEVDSVANRGSLTHSHRDYSVQVINALLAELDGIKGREGVVIIGCSNDLSRCDPALLRAGRLERIIRIGLPDVIELERMFRVRLRDDLRNDDLEPWPNLPSVWSEPTSNA
ncbi:AAA family ATPase [Bradyrhizobium sp. USDA 4529]